MSVNLTTTQTKHKNIYIYTYRQKPLKLLKIKKGPIDKTFHKTSGYMHTCISSGASALRGLIATTQSHAITVLYSFLLTYLLPAVIWHNSLRLT